MKNTKTTTLLFTFFLFIFIYILFSFHVFIQAEEILSRKTNKQLFPLQEQIISIINSYPAMHEIKTGVYAVSLKTGKILVDFHGDKLFIPASNQKLFTTAAALAKLGPDFSFPTIIYANHLPKDGLITGHLYLKGYGDPFLVNEELWELARQIKLAGVRKITGDLIFDDSYFAQEKDLPDDNPPFWYSAESGALSINFNTMAFLIQPSSEMGQNPSVHCNPSTSFIQVINRGLTSPASSSKTLSVTRQKDKNIFIISDKIPIDHPPVTIYRALKYPSQYTAKVLSEILIQLGINISGTICQGSIPSKAVVIYQHQSRPLSTIIASLNKISNNFIAQQILKTMGAEIKGGAGTTAKGIAVIKDFLKESGLDTKNFLAVDGCGLSRKNLTAPKTIVDLLTYTQRQFEYQPEYLSSLAVAGIDGTLKERLPNLKMYRKVRAKTGLLKGVSCLSGYVYSSNEEIIAFSILMNGKKDQQQMCKKIQDEIVTILLDSG